MKEVKQCRMFVERLKSGDDLLKRLEEIANEKSIKSATLQMIGALERADIGIYADKEYKHIYNECPMEIVSGMGNVSLKDGKPFIHMHLLLSDLNGKTLGGHLFNGCIVHPTAEVFITEVEPAIKRKFHDSANLWLFDI